MNCSESSIKFHWIAIIIGILAAISVSAETKTFSFSVEKKGKGDPIILIPGITCDGAVWDETVKVLSVNYECHVLTLPGFANQKPIDVNSDYLPTIEQEILNYIYKRKLEGAIVIGHSLGGYLALSIGSAYPELFSKLIIVDALPFFGAAQNPNATEESMKPIAKNMMDLFAGMPEEQYLSQQKMMLHTMITDSANIELAYKWGIDSDKATVSKAMYELYTTDLRDNIDKIEARTLVIGSWIGYKDYGVSRDMILSNMKLQYNNLDDVTIVLSDNGKHFIMWDDFSYFMDQINKFLTSTKIEG